MFLLCMFLILNLFDICQPFVCNILVGSHLVFYSLAGSLPIEDEEFEQEEEQKDANLNVSDGLDAGEQSADPTNDELQYPESVLQLTPFQVIRSSTSCTQWQELIMSSNFEW